MDTTLRLGNWAELEAGASAVRYDVFVQEQNVPLALEMDELDADCLHAVIYNTAGEAVATGRLLPSAHIGRMAVKANCRGQGLGAEVLLALREAAKARGDSTVFLSAQLHAVPFYSKYGFEAYGDVYEDAGITHRMMRCVVSS